MPKVKTWIYRNKNYTKDELAEIKGCGIATMYRILNGVPSGTKVDDILDNYIVKQPRRFYYKNVLYSIEELAKLKECSITLLDRQLTHVKNKSHVDEIVDNIAVGRNGAKQWLYRDVLRTSKEIAEIKHCSLSNIQRILRGVKEGCVVDDLVDIKRKSDRSIVYRYRNTNATVKQIAAQIDKSEYAVRKWLTPCNPGDDVTEVIAKHLITGDFIYEGEHVSLKDISRITGLKLGAVSNCSRKTKKVDLTEAIHQRLEKEKYNIVLEYDGKEVTRRRLAEECNTTFDRVCKVLEKFGITGGAVPPEVIRELLNKKYNMESISVYGEDLRLYEIVSKFGLKLPTVHANIDKYGPANIESWLESKGGVRRLELNSSIREYCDWICDDLWVYKNPETEEEQVLTTKEINELCENRSSDLEGNSGQ